MRCGPPALSGLTHPPPLPPCPAACLACCAALPELCSHLLCCASTPPRPLQLKQAADQGLDWLRSELPSFGAGFWTLLIVLTSIMLVGLSCCEKKNSTLEVALRPAAACGCALPCITASPAASGPGNPPCSLLLLLLLRARCDAPVVPPANTCAAGAAVAGAVACKGHIRPSRPHGYAHDWVRAPAVTHAAAC